jgi:hypothetical protein
MPAIFLSPEEKQREWTFAKKKLFHSGELLPNGSKLRRKDFPKKLNHSFLVIDDQIIALAGKGIYLGQGMFGIVKFAEDETGNQYALKRMENSNKAEASIANDLGLAGKSTVRSSFKKEKYYIPYQYLGIPLSKYISEHKDLSSDKKLELFTKICLELHEIHSGQKSKLKNSYSHCDIFEENIVIDNQDKPHFIDFGKAIANDLWDFRDHDVIDIFELFEYQGWLNISETLCDYRSNKSIKHSALDVALILTLSRFNLESCANIFTQKPQDKQLKIISILNATSTKINELYDKLLILSKQDNNLDSIVKKLLSSCLLDIIKNQPKNIISDELNLHLEKLDKKDATRIKQDVDAIISQIIGVKESQHKKNNHKLTDTQAKLFFSKKQKLTEMNQDPVRQKAKVFKPGYQS